MNLTERIESFSELGHIIRNATEGKKVQEAENLKSLINNQHIKNPWFTPENIRLALKNAGEKLTSGNLVKWTSDYPLLKEKYDPVTAGVIMAGNIPLVGFHDFLSVLISGNRLLAKISSKDPDLIIELGEILCSINENFRDFISFTSDNLTGFDAVIATGSDNSARYFEYYFANYPHIIRKNRNSMAIIEGDESEEELENLGLDIFSFFGLGCRNISKIFVPQGYDFGKMMNSWRSFSVIINHSKYANNYNYNKAIYLVNREKFFDTGFILLKENGSLSSPVGVLYFEYYNSPSCPISYINLNNDKIQCITGRNYLPFGTAQSPELWDYPDNIDILDFLLKKNMSGIL